MKPWYKSKTILFNIASGLAGTVAAGVQAFAPFMAPATFGVFALVVSLANIALRVITTEGISTSKE